MSQHLIDLMPADLREQCQAGARKGRMILAFTIAGGLLIALTTHSSLQRNKLREDLANARVQANLVLQLEKRRQAIEAQMHSDRRIVQTYERIAHPLEVSQVLASVINQLPESITLESIDIEAGARRKSVSARTARRNAQSEASPRRLTGELAGFAASDGEIAELVDRLAHLSPLQDVSLDFSRTRMVRGRLAREFRMSFVIDFEVSYDVLAGGMSVEGGQP